MFLGRFHRLSCDAPLSMEGFRFSQLKKNASCTRALAHPPSSVELLLYREIRILQPDGENRAGVCQRIATPSVDGRLLAIRRRPRPIRGRPALSRRQSHDGNLDPSTHAELSSCKGSTSVWRQRLKHNSPHECAIVHGLLWRPRLRWSLSLTKLELTC